MTMDDFALYLKNVREHLHAAPELYHKECGTQKYICDILKGLNIRFRTVKTGIIADIDGEDNSRRIALRTDMDALPVDEKNDVPYRSKNPGVMHACGHDGHMAMVLGAAKMLGENKPPINVRLIFQPAEECEGGAEMMIEAGATDGVDFVFGLHLSPKIQKGNIALSPGGFFAGACDYAVEITGKNSHCALKNEGIDALVSAVRFFDESYGKFFAGFDGKNLFHVGSVNGGKASNIVADKCRLQCTFRYFDKTVLDKWTDSQHEVLERISKQNETGFSLEVVNSYPPLINDAETVKKIAKLKGIVEGKPEYTAEDFAYYLQKTKGCFAWLGTREPGYTAPLHSPSFNFDSGVLTKGLEYYKSLIYGGVLY